MNAIYNSMKRLINKSFYADLESALTKLVVFYACNRLSDEQYVELSAIAVAQYGETA